jgi:hypothetical protein
MFLSEAEQRDEELITQQVARICIRDLEDAPYRFIYSSHLDKIPSLSIVYPGDIRLNSIGITKALCRNVRPSCISR